MGNLWVFLIKSTASSTTVDVTKQPFGEFTTNDFNSWAFSAAHQHSIRLVKSAFNGNGRSGKQFSIISLFSSLTLSLSILGMRAKWCREYRSIKSTITIKWRRQLQQRQQANKRTKKIESRSTHLFHAYFLYYCGNVTIVFDWQRCTCTRSLACYNSQESDDID